jgi:Uma2 family endonuclease
MTHAPDPNSQRIDIWGVPTVCVRVSESFDDLVALNPDLRIEQTASGEVIFMTPTGGESGRQNSRIIVQLGMWAEAHRGQVFDSSTLFQLPNGAKRSPDASWISDARWQQLTAKQRKGFPPVCPDFVIELRSESDRLADLQEKMEEYMQNGAQLGWLIDPLLAQAHVYQAGKQPEVLDRPQSLSGGELLPGFVLDLSRIWIES